MIVLLLFHWNLFESSECRRKCQRATTRWHCTEYTLLWRVVYWVSTVLVSGTGRRFVVCDDSVSPCQRAGNPHMKHRRASLSSSAGCWSFSWFTSSASDRITHGWKATTVLYSMIKTAPRAIYDDSFKVQSTLEEERPNAKCRVLESWLGSLVSCRVCIWKV